LKELIESYQQLLTKIEERIAYVSKEMRACDSAEGIKQLRIRRDTLREEYEDLIYALRRMARYADMPDTRVRIREVNAS